MKKIARIQKSRSTWKVKAVLRATQLRHQRKKSVRLQKRQDARRLELEERVGFLECENASLRSTAVRHLPAVIGGSSFDPRRTSCVMMVIEGTVSFRAVPRIWGVLQRLSWVKTQIPHFTSVIHWTLRAGMAVFNAVGHTDEPWLAIIDCSIDIGTRKALVVLRVPLPALHQREGAIGLQDCECIGLKIATRWTGLLARVTVRRANVAPTVPELLRSFRVRRDPDTNRHGLQRQKSVAFADFHAPFLFREAI